uniref:Putative secreted protein n=1 Tax=Anopheles triannulatus TaxID=58253 RepID=A0A2M4B825_9DIPT
MLKRHSTPLLVLLFLFNNRLDSGYILQTARLVLAHLCRIVALITMKHIEVEYYFSQTLSNTLRLFSWR